MMICASCGRPTSKYSTGCGDPCQADPITDEQAEAWLKANDLYAVTHIHESNDCDECLASRPSDERVPEEGA